MCPTPLGGGYSPLMRTLLLLAFAALAHPNAGQTQVVVVMKMADCPVCATQMKQLASAHLGAPVLAITHDDEVAAARVSSVTGVPTYSHATGIEAMGLWLPEQGIAQPAVVVYDKCGAETGRVVGRGPGTDATEAVRRLVRAANAVESCGKPVS